MPVHIEENDGLGEIQADVYRKKLQGAVVTPRQNKDEDCELENATGNPDDPKKGR